MEVVNTERAYDSLLSRGWIQAPNPDADNVRLFFKGDWACVLKPDLDRDTYVLEAEYCGACAKTTCDNFVVSVVIPLCKFTHERFDNVASRLQVEIQKWEQSWLIQGD